MDEVETEFSAPESNALLWESRVVLDAVRMLGPMLGVHLQPRRDMRALLVILAPGFGSDDRYLAPLRHYLSRRGFCAEGWGLGRNLAGINLPHRLEDLSERWQFSDKLDYNGEASVPYLCDRLIDRIRERHTETGLPVSLIGWSLGGYLCREAARDLPDIVRSVVTLGAPTIGGPKYTAAATLFRKRGMDLDWIEAEIKKREIVPIGQPITAIFSKSDGIVSWQACIDHYSENVQHVEINGSHLGLGFNPSVWKQILAALESTPRSGT
jgi:hypothetical protein